MNTMMLAIDRWSRLTFWCIPTVRMGNGLSEINFRNFGEVHLRKRNILLAMMACFEARNKILIVDSMMGCRRWVLFKLSFYLLVNFSLLVHYISNILIYFVFDRFVFLFYSFYSLCGCLNSFGSWFPDSFLFINHSTEHCIAFALNKCLIFLSIWFRSLYSLFIIQTLFWVRFA